ncbi:MAG: putative glycoside hydrolase [Roseburia sp.]
MQQTLRREETEAAEMTAEAESAQETSGVLVIEDAEEDKNKTISVRIVDSSNPALPGREAKKVRGIYITGPVAGNEEVLNSVLDGALTAGINAVVIDFKEDQGRITCPVDAATVNEIGASIPYVRDMKGLIEGLQEEGSLCDRASRGLQDSYLAEKKPEWSLKLPDGSLYQDRQGMCLGGSVPPGGLGLSSGSRDRGERSRL